MATVPLVADGWSSRVRPVLAGEAGAVAAAHPLAVAAGQAMLAAGGSAVDAAIAAQAMLCVLAPDACGLGGDMLALVDDGAATTAIAGAGAAPLGLVRAATDGAGSVTVPGIVDGWATMHARWGRLPLADALAPAVRAARDGCRISADLHAAAERQRARLVRGGAGGWPLLALAAGARLAQPELARLLSAIGEHGAAAFYRGGAAAAIVAAIGHGGGAMTTDDLARHATLVATPIVVRFGDIEVAVQPPPAQGVLLAMALRALDRHAPADASQAEHLAIELTEAAFRHRDDVARGAALLDVPLAADPERAARRGGPRAYLHTAGVATADAGGLVVSSLVSVFDDFGSGVFVPELGIVLNNRAGGFTAGANAAAPGGRPVHTLAPALLRTPRGRLGIASPGADGQVQTLLQLIDRIARRGEDLATAIAAPRWRSEAGAILIEADHPAAAPLAARGHRLHPTPPGDMRFGAVVAAGTIDGGPIAAADWRRRTWAGVG